MLPITLFLLTSSSCKQTATDRLILLSLSGERVPEQALIQKGTLVFFSCGCSPCHKAAERLSSISTSIQCISDLPQHRLSKFVADTKWQGTALQDKAGVFMIKYGFSDCPSFAEGTGAGLQRLSVSELENKLYGKKGGRS